MKKAKKYIHTKYKLLYRNIRDREVKLAWIECKDANNNDLKKCAADSDNRSNKMHQTNLFVLAL